MANEMYGQFANPQQFGVYGQRQNIPYNQQQNWVQPYQVPPTVPATQPVATQPGFMCRPVASLEEAKAVPTDFNGNMLIMTDLSHGAIYTKVLDTATGSARFEIYARVPEQQMQEKAEVEYAPLDVVNKAISKLDRKIDDLRSDFEGTVYEEVKRVVPKKGKAAE